MTPLKTSKFVAQNFLIIMPLILIAEDHEIVRLGTILLIRELYSEAEIIEVGTFPEVIEQVKKRSFDLLVLDIQIPGGDHFQMIEAVRLRQPGLKILMFSAYDEDIYAVRYLNAGANGYLQKDSDAKEMEIAIKQVLNNEKYISPKLQKQLVDCYVGADSAKRPITTLTNREMEVMHLLAKGLSSSEIKNRLNIQYSTISTYKERIFEKMNVSNIVELANAVRMSS